MNSLPNLGIVLLVFILSLLFYSNSTTYAVKVDRYWAVLTAYNEITPNTSNAVGFVALKFQEDFKKLIFSINVDNIDNVTGIYIYQGDKNQSASIVLDLIQEARERGNDDTNIVKISKNGEITGTLAVGGVTSEDLQGQLKGKSLKDLYNSIINRTAYICVHTKDFPEGEISAGSFIPTDRVFPDMSDFNWN
ncbi:MAG: CHRD domain-containing protein [Nitrososphaeraceae archaeon]|nr:CHRD domain-containing protein [Nitrososphaeraceae archaeon]